jgi:hypothetical protein
MGVDTMPPPYPEENLHVHILYASMCRSVTGDEAGISRILSEVNGDFPETN